MEQRKPGAKSHHVERLNIALPARLKQRLVEDADREERSLSELARERLAAPYREEGHQK